MHFVTPSPAVAVDLIRNANKPTGSAEACSILAGPMRASLLRPWIRDGIWPILYAIQILAFGRVNKM
jgi:hypothetical protein